MSLCWFGEGLWPKTDRIIHITFDFDFIYSRKRSLILHLFMHPKFFARFTPLISLPRLPIRTLYKPRRLFPPIEILYAILDMLVSVY